MGSVIAETLVPVGLWIGALATFLGTTRDTNRGQRVRRLEYEAFEAMTGPEMARIFDDCRALLGEAGAGSRMLVAHRVGVVPVGEPSVVVAVVAPSSARMQRTTRASPSETKPGTASLQAGMASRQRGANVQRVGAADKFGGEPAIGSRRRPRDALWMVEARSPCV